MYKAIPLAVLLALAACATPQQQCIAKVSGEYKGLAAQAQVARDNIARGYAIHRQRVPYRVVGTCTNTLGEPYPCMQTRHRMQETPVAIDVAAERQKLAEIEARMAASKARTEAAVAQCRSAYPE